MTAASKTIVGLVFAACISVIVYQAHEIAELRHGIEASQEQQRQWEQTKQELGELKSQLIGVAAENERLHLELASIPKLRAEVTRLTKVNDAQTQSAGPGRVKRNPVESNSEPELDAEQKQALAEQTGLIWTHNSVADLARLKDSLARWDELFITNCPAKMVPVFMILKDRVAERVSILEMEAAKGRVEQGQP